ITNAMIQMSKAAGWGIVVLLLTIAGVLVAGQLESRILNSKLRIGRSILSAGSKAEYGGSSRADRSEYPDQNLPGGHGGVNTPAARRISPSTNRTAARNSPMADIVMSAYAARVRHASGGLNATSSERSPM